MTKKLRIVLVLIAVLLIQACAIGPKVTWQKFTFHGKEDGWAATVDLLEYAYGDQDRMTAETIVKPRGPAYGNGKSLAPQLDVNGPMPVGEFLHVKWRVRATGEIVQERVDLRHRLPSDMTDHGLTYRDRWQTTVRVRHHAQIQTVRQSPGSQNVVLQELPRLRNFSEV